MGEAQQIRTELTLLRNDLRKLQKMLDKGVLSAKQEEFFSNKASCIKEKIGNLERDEELIISLIDNKQGFIVKRDIVLNRCSKIKQGTKVFCKDIVFHYDPKFYAFKTQYGKNTFFVDELKFNDELVRA